MLRSLKQNLPGITATGLDGVDYLNSMDTKKPHDADSYTALDYFSTPKVVIFAGMTKGCKENFCKGNEKFLKMFEKQTLSKLKGWNCFQDVFFTNLN